MDRTRCRRGQPYSPRAAQRPAATVEFNPLEVAAHRLIGYENRLLAAQDFNDDTKDAGEIGAGHTVTALYEVVPAELGIDETVLGSVGGDALEHEQPGVDPLRYRVIGEPSQAATSGELLTVKLRYKQPDGDTSQLMEYGITDEGHALGDTTTDFRFAASVASFGMLLRNSPHCAGWTYGAALELASEAVGDDAYGYRHEFLDLVRTAREIGR